MLFTEVFCLSKMEQVWSEVSVRGFAAELTLHQTIGFTATTRLREPESFEQDENIELNLTLYDSKQRSASATTTDLSLAGIRSLVEKAATLVEYAQPDFASGLPDSHLLAKTVPDLALFTPWKLPISQAFEYAKSCEQLACTHSSSLRSEGVSLQSTESVHFYANTEGTQLYYPETLHSISCQLLSETTSGAKEREGAYTVARDANELMSIEKLAKLAAKNTLRRLHARKVKTQKVDVIFEAPVAKTLLKHFIQAASGSALYTQSSFLVEKRGETIFPEHCSIVQKPHERKGVGSAPFDAEGVKTQEQVYVDNGILSSYFLGTYSARRLGLESTGNAGGVYNLKLTHSNKDLENLLSEMRRGVLVTELLGQGVDILTGNYSRGAVGFWVEEGEIQYPIDAFTLAGNLSDMFKNIVAVAQDVDRQGRLHTGSIWVANMMLSGAGK